MARDKIRNEATRQRSPIWLLILGAAAMLLYLAIPGYNLWPF